MRVEIYDGLRFCLLLLDSMRVEILLVIIANKLTQLRFCCFVDSLLVCIHLIFY